MSETEARVPCKKIPGTDLIVAADLFDFMAKKVGQLRVATYLCDGYVAKDIVTTNEGNYVRAAADRVDGELSYLPKAKIAQVVKGLSSSELMRVKGRMVAKPGKAIRKFINPAVLGTGTFVLSAKAFDGSDITLSQITDADIEVFVVALQAHFKPIEFVIVTGEAIRHWYYQHNYTSEESSSLHNSCMRYSRNWHQIRSYAQNPRTVGLLCVFDTSHKLKGRALVWNSPMGLVMDRVYGSDQTRAAMRRFATDRGWMTRGGDMAQHHGLQNANGNSVAFYAVPFQRWTGDMPYLDSLHTSYLRASGDFDTECTDLYEMNVKRNPKEYAFAYYGSLADAPIDHPLHSRDRRRQSEANRGRRVDWCSNFEAIPPWPADLLRDDPSWRLDDPEDNAANWERVPTRRTEPLVITRPKPNPTTWITGASTTIKTSGINALADNMAALAQAFAAVARVIPPIHLVAFDDLDAAGNG